MKPVVVICCVCRRIRGDVGPEDGAGLWYEPQLYLARHSLGAEDFQVSQTYCPSCLTTSCRWFAPQHPAAEHRGS
jgi:hypothetical protein